MIPLPWIIGGFAMYLAVNYVARRRDPKRIRLPDGRRVRLLSSVAILNASSCRLLTFEYLSGLADPDPDDVRDEALIFLRTVTARPEYARCLDATVTVRLPGEDHAAPAPANRILAFGREDAGSAWYPVERARSVPGVSREP
ncbi:MAG: hypothetical protein ACREM9_03995 [Gemmatimonadales bacterium]